MQTQEGADVYVLSEDTSRIPLSTCLYTRRGVMRLISSWDAAGYFSTLANELSSQALPCGFQTLREESAAREGRRLRVGTLSCYEGWAVTLNSQAGPERSLDLRGVQTTWCQAAGGCRPTAAPAAPGSAASVPANPGDRGKRPALKAFKLVKFSLMQAFKGQAFPTEEEVIFRSQQITS